eukprot:gene29803-7439_t
MILEASGSSRERVDKILLSSSSEKKKKVNRRKDTDSAGSEPTADSHSEHPVLPRRVFANMFADAPYTELPPTYAMFRRRLDVVVEPAARRLGPASLPNHAANLQPKWPSRSAASMLLRVSSIPLALLFQFATSCLKKSALSVVMPSKR